MTDHSSDAALGLFASIDGGTIENLILKDVSIVGSMTGSDVIGTLASTAGGYFFRDFVTGAIRLQGGGDFVGGLIGSGTSADVEQSSAGVQISGESADVVFAGGIIGEGDYDAIDESFWTGSINVGSYAVAGGLTGWIFSDSDLQIITNSYTTGSVTGGMSSQIGGVIGTGCELPGCTVTVADTYSMGAVAGGPSSLVGGFVGRAKSEYTKFIDGYWDTTTSGTHHAAGKGHKSGIESLTTKQFRAGVPFGFDSAIWADRKGLNDGLPYLIANPPGK